MVFLPGVVGSLLLASFFVRKRLSGGRVFQEQGVLPDQTPYHFTENRHKGRLRSAYLGVETSSGHYFGIKKESFLDRLFKWIGLSAEIQTKNKEFNKAYYLMSDNPMLCELLSSNKAFQKAMEVLTGLGVKKVEALPLMVWTKVSAENYTEHRATIVLQLKVISDTLKSLPPIPKMPFFNKSARIAIIYNVLHACFLVLGIYGLLVNPFRDTEMIDMVPLVIKSGSIGSILAGLWFISIVLIAGRSSRGHIVLLDFIVMGLPGMFMTTYSSLYEYNVISDRSVPQHFEREIVNKDYKRRRKGGTTYYLALYGFIEEDGVHKKQVNAKTYKAAQIGAKARVTLREGALGYRWVDKIELIK